MAVSYYPFIATTFLLSSLSIALLVASIVTEKWLVAEAFRKFDDGKDLINYGLYKGALVSRVFGRPTITDIHLTCITEKNVCAFSCETTSEKRKDEISTFLNETIPEYICGSSTLNIPTVNIVLRDVVWYNVGIYISIFIFLGLSLVFGLISAFLGVYNSSISPVEPLLGVFGLYIWLGCSAVCHLLVLILWGAHFETNLKTNLAFTYTVVLHENVSATVGYSYWLVFASMLCHIVSEVLLVVRLWLIKIEPPPPTITIDQNTDNTIFLY